MFNYHDKILKKFKVIDTISIGSNMAFLGLFIYIYYKYNNYELNQWIFLASSITCIITLIGIFINRLKYKKEILDEAKKESEYNTIEDILKDLTIGKIICVQSPQDVGFIKMDSDKLLFYLEHGNQKIERTLETGEMHIRRLLNDPVTGLYQNGFLFSIREKESTMI